MISINLSIYQSIYHHHHLSNQMDTASDIYPTTAWYDTGGCRSLMVLKSACRSRHFSRIFVQKKQCVPFVELLLQSTPRCCYQNLPLGVKKCLQHLKSSQTSETYFVPISPSFIRKMMWKSLKTSTFFRKQSLNGPTEWRTSF